MRAASQPRPHHHHHHPVERHMMYRVSARDSGKPMVDAAFGEVMVTCEKIWWLVKQGRQYLLPERRKAGAMVRLLCCKSSHEPALWRCG